MTTAASPFARPPVAVLLHHFGGSRRTWADVVAKLGDGCACVSPDLRGFGGSSATEAESTGDGKPFTVEDAADDVVGRCDALGVDRFVVVGHSMGGRVAMAVAARQPRRVAGLVLLAPSPPTPEPMTNDGRETLLHARDDRFAAERTVDHITGQPKLSPERAAAAVDDILAADPVAWRAWVEVGSKQDLTALVCGITCPTVVLSGDHDAAIPTDVIERDVVGRIAGAELVRVPGAGHLLPLEAPDAVADAIRRMLDRVTPPGPIASVRDLAATDLTTPPTRRVLQERAAWRSQGPQFFTPDEMRTLAALCDAMVPQDGPDDPGGGRYRVDIAGEMDRRVGNGGGNGWRYADLPGDGEAYRRGLAAFDDVAGGAFHEKSRGERLKILTDIRAGDGEGPAWQSRGLVAKRVLEEWLAEAVEIYYSHPGGGQADLGYVGFADARGWRLVQLDEREPQEQLFPSPPLSPAGDVPRHPSMVRASHDVPPIKTN